MGKFRAVAVCALALAFGAPIASCLDATEIVIGLTANVDCNTVQKNGAIIHIGSSATVDTTPSTDLTSSVCMSHDATTLNDLGSVVILPSGSVDSSVAINVLLSIDPTKKTDTCLADQGSSWCISARRQISFLPHTHVYLPIELDASCAGKPCVAGVSTCQAGVCIPINVDSSDCGTQCTTGPDAVPPIDANPMFDSSVDSPIIDSPVNVDSPDGPVLCLDTICGSACVDLDTDLQNCGACGLDCSGGQCIAGTCQLHATAPGSCLVVYNNQVWVQSGSYVGHVPTNGGTPTLVAQNTIYAIAAVPTQKLAWFEKIGLQPQLFEQTSNTTYNEVGSAEFLAISPKVGYAWSDPVGGVVGFQPNTGTATTVSTIPKQTVPIAVAETNLYASLSTQVMWKPFASQAAYLTATNPTSIIVDDPTSATPTVYFVDKGTNVLVTDYKLTNAQLFAKASATITALAWDFTKSTVVANLGTEIDIVVNGSFVTAAKTINAQPKCVAVDANAVYWIEQAGGVYKHAKP